MTKRNPSPIFDAGSCYCVIQPVFTNYDYGVHVQPEGHGTLLPGECRRLAAWLILAADRCEKLNSRRRQKGK